MAKAKSELEQLLTGTVVLNDAKGALWDGYFSSNLGFSYLRSLSRPRKLFVHRDLRRRQLVFHGSPELFHETRSAIKSKLFEHLESTYPILLEEGLLEKALTGGFQRIVNRFGKHRAKLDITGKPPLMILQGSMEDGRIARSLLENAGTDEDWLGVGRPRECPACTTEPENPIQLQCGHVYCRDCFEAQCQADNGGQIPVTCIGDACNCQHTVSLIELRRILSHETFEEVLMKSLDFHVRSHPDLLQYCPTADCPTIYRVSEDGTTVCCTSCLTSICTTCKAVAHDGLTCNEVKYITSEEFKQVDDFKKANQIKDCPKCKTSFEKEMGCHHMICGGCGIDIC